jgi:protein-tyrosine-phosphatase
VPSLPLPRALARAAERPLLQTSCNRSGEPAALNGAAVAASLGDRVDLLLDGGRVPGGRSSTVVLCDARRFRILRRGAVKTAEIIRAAAELTLLVCTGNLCRSPLAEAILGEEVARRLDCDPDAVVGHGFRFASFGITAPEGEPPTDHAVRVAGELGLDIGKHRSRPFRIARVDEAARVYGMTRAHLDFLSPYFIRRPDDLCLLAPKGREIPDPYGRSLKVYRRTAELIREACEQRAEELVPDDPGDEGE